VSCGARGAGAAGSCRSWKEHVHEPTIDKLTDYDTSSTARGGGGSFKDSTIGEVSSCDALVAERID